MTYRVIPYGIRILGYQADPTAIVAFWMTRRSTPQSFIRERTAWIGTTSGTRTLPPPLYAAPQRAACAVLQGIGSSVNECLLHVFLITLVVAVDTSELPDEDEILMAFGTLPTVDEGASRFELAPPRRFVPPAILLLLSEQPGYGYGLVPRLEEFQFGHVDRPAVYRALAQLETDGLVEARSQNPTAGQSRRVYSLTPMGERVLGVWMGVNKDEHDYLGQVLRRYQATGTTDAVLAEVWGGWSSALGVAWSPVSSTSDGRSRFNPAELERDELPPHVERDTSVITPAEAARSKHFRLDPERSAVLIDVRSTVGPLSFGTLGVSGSFQAAIAGGVLHLDFAPSGLTRYTPLNCRPESTDSVMALRMRSRSSGWISSRYDSNVPSKSNGSTA